MRRARLRRVVIAAVSACALILVAAGIVRVVHASSETSPAPRTAATSGATAGATPVAAAAAIAPGASPAAAPAPDTAAASTATTGTLRLERNLMPRSVWLDGRKLGTRNEVVTCGPHQLKVGRARARAIDVPCGGDLRIAR
jgi:hypothetical protein